VGLFEEIYPHEDAVSEVGRVLDASFLQVNSMREMMLIKAVRST